MNVDDYLTAAADALQHGPTNIEVKRTRVRDLNRVHRRLLGTAPWNFLQSEVELQLYADEVVSNVSASADFTGLFTLTNGNGSYTAGFSQPTRWNGHHIDLADDVTDAATGDRVQIGRVATTNGWLTTPWEGTTDTYSGTVKYLRYLLPEDCADVLGIIDRNGDRGEITYVGRAEEKLRRLNDDITGPPDGWLYDEQETFRAPRSLTAAASGAGGSLTVGTKYRYLVCWEWKGMEGQRSPIVEFTATATGEITLTYEALVSAEKDGAYANIYREDGSSGEFLFLAQVTAGSTGSYVDDGTVALDTFRPYVTSTERRTVRFYPRPASDMKVHVRYLRRVPELRHDTDASPVPEDFHDVLMHAFILELGARHGAEASLMAYHRELYRERETLLRARELHAGAEVDSKAMWGPTRHRVIPAFGAVTFTG